MRIAVIPAADRVPATIRCLRKHTGLPVGELRDKLASATPIVDFPSDRVILTAVRRCRALLRDLDAAGATVRIWESHKGVTDREVPREFLHHQMRSMIGIAREVRDQAYREAESDQ